jgi:diadenosine tetraphosphate (Ap4A) HIT family hydrolase
MIPFTLHAQIEADSVFLRDLPLSQVRLQNQNALPWLILLPRREVTEIYHLSPDDRAQLMEEIALVSEVLVRAFVPDKINVASLGNYVPQLHMHVVGRFKNDPAWPQPVWGKLSPKPYTEEALQNVRQRLNDIALWR